MSTSSRCGAPMHSEGALLWVALFLLFWTVLDANPLAAQPVRPGSPSLSGTEPCAIKCATFRPLLSMHAYSNA